MTAALITKHQRLLCINDTSRHCTKGERNIAEHSNIPIFASHIHRVDQARDGNTTRRQSICTFHLYSPAIRSTARSAGSSCRMLKGLSFAHSLRLPSNSNSMVPAAAIQADRLFTLYTMPSCRVASSGRTGPLLATSFRARAATTLRQHNIRRRLAGIVYIVRRTTPRTRLARHVPRDVHVRAHYGNVTRTQTCILLSLALLCFRFPALSVICSTNKTISLERDRVFPLQ